MVKKKIFNGRKQTMKKRVISLMTLVATVAALASCNKKEEEAPIVDGAYQYRFELAEDGTRATLNDKGVFWKAGEDHVGLFVGTGVNARQADIEEVDEKTMVKLVSDDPLEGKTAYAFYPYYKNTDGSANASLYINPQQMGGGVSAMPMVGIPYEIQSGENNGRINFMNMGSIIDFRVYSSNETYQNETVRYITYQATNDQAAVAGLAKVDLTVVTEETPGTLNWTAEGADPEKEVTLTLMETVNVAAKKDDATTPQYMVLAPGTYSGKITVVTNAAAYEFSFENKELKRNMIHKYTMNLGGNNATRKSVYYKAESMVYGKKYLIISNGRSLQNASSSTLSVVSVEESIKDDGTIIYDAPNAALWEASSSGKLKNSQTSRFLAYSNSSLSTRSSESSGSEFVYNNFTLVVSNRFVYCSGDSFTTSSSEHTTILYTTDAPTTNPSWIMSYDATEAVYDMNSTLAEHWDPYCPKLTCEDGANVTYASSNTAVATVDENGIVTALERGSTTITAIATGDGHSETRASYTLKVIDSSIPPSVYTKVTKVDDLEPDAQYLIVFEGLEGDTDGDGDPKVFHPVLNTDGNTYVKNVSSALDVTIDNSSITIDNSSITSADIADCELTLEDGYYFKTGGSCNNKYIYPSGTSGNSGTLSAESTASTKLGITFDDNGIAQIKANSGSFYFVWSVSSHYFSSSEAISGQYSTGICLYKLDDGRQTQNMQFAAAEAQYDIFNNDWVEGMGVPALNGNETTPVVYESSNPAVATVDESGAVEIQSGVQSGDTAVITATAPQNENYKKATASYTIKIVNNDPNIATYTKVNSASDLEADAKYILVYETNKKVFKPILKSAGISFEKTANNAVDVVINGEEIASNDLTDYQLTFEAGKFLYVASADKYLYPGASGDDAIGAEGINLDHTLAITISSGVANIKCSDSDNHLYWSSSGYFSSISNTGTSYVSTLSLYKLNDNRTAQTLSFSGSEAKYDIAKSEWTVDVPTLSGAETDVTYTSSNEIVATVTKVDNTAVTVTIASGAMKNDVAVIKATAAGSTTVKPATAFFKVTVIDTNVPKYYKVDELENNQSYLIVSNGYALSLSGTSVKADAITETGTVGVIQFDESATSNSPLWTATVSGTSVKVKNGSNYLRHSSNGASFSIGTSDSRNAIVYDAANNTVKVGNYYLNYSGSSFSLNSSATNTSAAFYSATKPLPSLKFDKTSVTFDLATNDWIGAMPVLSPANADVTYSFVNNNNANIISSIDANGAVTLVASPTKGTATVTAAAKTPSDYKVASASFTVQVINSNEIPTYTKVDEIISGGTYLIVSHLDNLAFEGDAETPTGASKSVTPNNGIITASSYMEYEAYEVVIKEESSEHYSIYFTKLKRYLALDNSTNSGLSSSDSWASGNTSTDFTMSKVASGDYSGSFLFAARSSDSRVLYHNDTQFKLGGSGTSKGVHLYKKN